MNGEEAQDLEPQETSDRNGYNRHLDEQNRNIDRIRDVLFGQQLRDYDTRLERLSDRLTSETAEIRAELLKSVAALENGLKTELESLTNCLAGERFERRIIIEQLMRNLAQTTGTFELKIQSLDQKVAGEIQNLRGQLLEQCNALSAEMKARDEIQSNLSRDTAQVREAVMRREALAEMLSEVSLRQRMRNEFPARAA